VGEVHDEGVPTTGVAAKSVVSVADDVVPTTIEEPSIRSPTPPTPPPQPSHDQPSTSQDKIAQALEISKLKQKEHANKVLSMQDDKVESSKLQEVVEVVTTVKLITEVVTSASTTITVVSPQLTTTTAPTLTTAPSAARRRKRVVIRDPQETATPSAVIHSEAESKDKGKGILVEEPKLLKKQAQIKQDEAYARELEAELNKNIDWDELIDHMDYFKGMTYDDIRPIFEKKFNSNVAFLLKTKEQMDEEDSRALKRLSESQDDKTAKKQKLDDELRNFDREDLEVLWRLVKERFASTKPKNFSDDFLLTTLGTMFEKPDVQAKIWKKSKKCSWSSEDQELEAVRVLWCADYHIHYNIVDFAGREEIFTYKVHYGSDTQ
nr:hypothetical protein [Tanacetum cinerariifolium]